MTSENNPVGNAAAMREALKGILKDVDCAKVNKQCDIDYFLSSIEKRAKAALSSPPRNCDAGTAEEQSQRYNSFCYGHRTYEKCCEGCPVVKSACCELAWAQMPYEAEQEGAGK